MYNFIQNPAPQYYQQSGMMQPAAQPQLVVELLVNK